MKRRVACVALDGASIAIARLAVRGDVVHVDGGARGVRDARAVGRREADEVLGLVRVALQIAAVGPHGVEVADAFVVAQEEDAFADPHRPDEIAGQAHESRERSVAAVDPQVARRTAAVALPARRVVVVPADREAAVGVLGERARVAEAQRLGAAAGGRDA